MTLGTLGLKPRLKEQIDRHVLEGFKVVQSGEFVRSDDRKATFSDQARGFDVSLLGSYRPPSYRSQFDNLLLDEGDRWVHLRRARVDARVPTMTWPSHPPSSSRSTTEGQADAATAPDRYSGES